MEGCRSDSVTTSKRVNELNGTVGVRELPFELTLDLYGCSKLPGNYSHAVKTGVVAQQLSDCSFKRGQALLYGPVRAPADQYGHYFLSG
jgi:hypothetical protein